VHNRTDSAVDQERWWTDVEGSGAACLATDVNRYSRHTDGGAARDLKGNVDRSCVHLLVDEDVEIANHCKNQYR